MLSDTAVIGAHEQSLRALGATENGRSTKEHRGRHVAAVLAI